MRRHVLLLLIAAANLAANGTAQDDCSGHGRLVDGKCQCENPWPQAKEKGWQGPQCSIPVFGGTADGGDMAAWCQAPNHCNSLEAGGWACFAVRAPWKPATAGEADWNFLTVLVNRTSADEKGDPDMFGMWTGGAERGMAVPNTTAKGYDFQDTSSSSHPTIVKLLKKADYGADHDYEGAYICVRAYGSQAVDFALHATLTACPASYDGEGTPLMCHSRLDAPEEERRYSACTAEGVCQCTGEYAKPVPAVFAGIGFEDCSTPVFNISRAELSANRTFQLEHETVEPDQWREYRFHVEEGDYEVVVTAVVEGNSSMGGSLDMYLKAEQPAGWGPRQYDLRPRWNAATRDTSLQVVLDPTLTQWRTGVWFAGVVGSDAPVNYTLTITKYDCPGNCSSHGTCITNSTEPPLRKECRCDEGFGGVDCSKVSQALEYGKVVEAAPAAFELNYYSLPQPTDSMLAGNVELVVEASYFSTSFSHWLEAHPSVLLAKANGSSSYPSASRFTHKLSLDQPGVTYNLSLCPSQVRHGHWKLAVYNPMPTMPLAYNLTVHKIGRCLNNCSDNGSCNSDGICQCQDNWTGGDCSAALNASCLVGSRRAADRPEQHGTCWQECRCDDAGKNCSFTDDCAGFSCQAGFRRQGNETACVQDECTKDEFKADNDFVCLRNCTCPAAGGPCTLDKDCSIKIDIKGGGGGGRQGVSGGKVFFWMLVSLCLGGAAALGYVHYYGVPPWLPIRERGYAGMYNELSEQQGL